MSGASKILIGSGGVDLPSDDEFDNVSFLSHFDGSNNGTNIVYDDGSDSDHTITAQGATTQGTSGPFARVDGEWSNLFDGSGYLVNLAGSGDFAFGTGDFTVEAFFNTNDATADTYYRRIYMTDYGYGNTDANPQIAITTSGTLNAYSNAGSLDIIGTTNVADGAWHHVAMVRSSGTVTLYVDGTSEGTPASYTEDVNMNDSVCRPEIGAFQLEGNGRWNGYISNVRVLKGTALYTGNFTPPTSALTAITNTKLLTCQSNRFIDNSASDHTLTIGGTPRVSAFTPILTSEVYDSAVNGASIYFDGDGHYLSAADSADWTLGDTFTVEAWIYPRALNAYNIVVAQGSNFYYTAGTTRMAFYSASTDTHSDEVLELNQWSHVAFSVSSGTGYHYINGLRSGTVGTSIDVGDASDVLQIGKQVSSWPFKGYMSDVRIVKGTAVYSGTTYTIPTAPLANITNTKLLLNMADGQAIDSAAQNNLFLYGTADTSTTQYKFGTASLFLEGDSDTDFAQIRDATDLTGPFTIECWARAADTDNAWLWCQGQYTAALGITGDTLRGALPSYVNFFTSGEFTVNTWHHVALVRDTSDVIKCYLNGTASGTTLTSSATFVATNGIFIIGGEYLSSESINHGWDGYVDDFRISQFARYTSNFTPSTEAFPDKGQ